MIQVLLPNAPATVSVPRTLLARFREAYLAYDVRVQSVQAAYDSLQALNSLVHELLNSSEPDSVRGLDYHIYQTSLIKELDIASRAYELSYQRYCARPMPNEERSTMNQEAGIRLANAVKTMLVKAGLLDATE